MLPLLDQTREPFAPSEAEALIASRGAQTLEAIAKAGQDIKVTVIDDPSVIVPLPARAVQIIHDILDIMARRVPVSIIPHDAVLTTQQAADYLNVSRPFVSRLIDDGKIPANLVGRHRRVRFSDLLEFEEGSRKERKAALSSLAEEATRLNLD